MRDINTLNILVRADIPSCPDFVIERHAIRVMRDFCVQTQIWKDTLTGTIDEGEDDFTLAPANGEVCFVISLDIDNSLSWEFQPPDKVVFDEDMSEDSDIEVQVVLQPKLSDTQAPEWILDRYEGVLVKGIFSRMLRQNGQAWSNPNLALAYEQEYRKSIARARIEKIKQFTNQSLRVKPRRFV